MILALLVALGAGLGACCRYTLDQLIGRRHFGFPWGTFVVNVSGSFALGLVTGASLHHGLPTMPTVVLAAGFAASYTTWSTWMWETVALAEAGSPLVAGLNLVGELAGGLAAAGAGLALMTI